MDDVRTGARGARLPIAFLCGMALLGLVARLAFGLAYWTDKPMTRDEHEYLSLARSLAAGDGFVYDPVLTASAIEPFGRAPGYPAFLALVGGGRHVTASVPAAVQIAQSIAGAAGVLLVGLLAHRLAGDAAARAAAALAALYPPLVWIAGYALSEALFWPIGLLLAWRFDHMLQQRNRLAPALVCGLVLGAGILVRPALVLFAPLAALLLARRGQWRPLMLLAVGALLVVGPWTARNYTHHGRFVFVASEGGVTFWTGNHPLAIGDGDMAANLPIKLDNQRLRQQHAGVGEEDLEPIYYREAFDWIRQHPFEWLSLELRKVFYLVVPAGPSYTLHSMRYYLASVLSYGAVFLLAALALFRSRVPLAPLPGLGILVASAVLVALIFFPQERFRIPIVDPALVILAGAGLATLRSSRHA